MPRLTGKVALVTGASRGIGAAIARKLASDGAAVAVNYARNAAAADQVVADVERAGGRAVAVRADLTDVGQIEPMVARAADALGGRIDVLVNNAGWAQFGRPLGTLDLDHYHRQMDLNVRGLLFATQAAVARMPAGGRVINIGSGVTRSPSPGGVVYCLSKAAVEMITRVHAKELGSKGITVNCVSPGVTESDLMNEVMPPEYLPTIITQTPLGRLGQPQDIADVVAFVASDEARWITGEILGATGGL